MICLNNNSNININNINLRKIYFNGNRKKANTYNFNSEKVKLNKDFNLNELNRIKNFKTILYKKPEGTEKNLYRNGTISNISKGNLSNETINLNDIHLNTININYDKNTNNNDKKENKFIKKIYSNIIKNNINPNLKKQITNKTKLYNNITYKGPLARNNKLFNNPLHLSYNNNNFPKLILLKNILFNINIFGIKFNFFI